MKLIGLISAAALSLTLAIAAPAIAQDQHEHQPEQKDNQKEEKHARPEGKKIQTAKPSERKQQQAKDSKPAPGQNERRAHAESRPAQPKHQQAQQHQSARPQRTQAQQKIQRTAWDKHRSQHWDTDHRNWQQRGGYHGYRIPDDRFRGYFGQDHGFRIVGLPFLVVGGYPRFQYQGYWLSAVDPWPEYWGNDWYDNDDVYVTYVDNGYYLYNRRYPNVGIAISISM